MKSFMLVFFSVVGLLFASWVREWQEVTVTQWNCWWGLPRSTHAQFTSSEVRCTVFPRERHILNATCVATYFKDFSASTQVITLVLSSFFKINILSIEILKWAFCFFSHKHFIPKQGGGVPDLGKIPTFSRFFFGDFPKSTWYQDGLCQ